MLTDTFHPPTRAARFALRAVVWSLGLFGLLRLGWIEMHVVLPFTRVQAGLAFGMFGTPTLPVDVTLACSGSDALALCLGAILAYPVRWRARLAGAGGGAALILGLNTLRIGTLGQAAASPVWFHALHVYVWPAVLVLAIAGYVFGWMRVADRSALAEPSADTGDARPRRLGAAWRFILLSAGGFLVFVAAAPLYLESGSALSVAAFVARAAAATHRMLGFQAIAAGNLLVTPGGAVVVTRDCISTPLIPVCLAAVLAYLGTYRRMALGLLAMPPLFVGLAVARLMVVALPEAAMASPIFVVHAFYQLLFGAVVVFVAALWRHGGRSAPGHALAGVSVGVAFVVLLGPVYTRVVTAHTGPPLDDPQGALAFLPAFQIGLYFALGAAAFAAVAWKRFLAGLACLALTQAAGLLALAALASHAGLTAQVRDVRAWAIAGPVLIFAAVVNGARTGR